MIERDKLLNMYIVDKLSVADISKILECSENKVNYWLYKYSIPKRSISDSQYAKRNPNGDPFVSIPNLPNNFIAGLGMGIFWGEGTKRSTSSVRLGNSDPKLINAFIDFLVKVFKINKDKLRFGVQIFQDMDKKSVLDYWQRNLSVPRSSFLKTVVISKSGKRGTYKEKSFYGVVTMYFNNVKLKNIIDTYLEDIRKMY